MAAYAIMLNPYVYHLVLKVGIAASEALTDEEVILRWRRVFPGIDLAALLRTMVYVDLNLVRANIVKTPEESQFTSIHRRLNNSNHGLILFKLKELSGEPPQELCLPLTQNQYLELLDWTGRTHLQKNRGAIPSDIPPILNRLNYTAQQWMRSVKRETTWQQKALGSVVQIKRFCDAIGQRWIWSTHDRVT